jgi:2-polyprenyl-3-methyl-5-hydroxy-6-metoxy-1,4-benzoquinol methylase/glycosyltransferase involved in cell wall biosynthesis
MGEERMAVSTSALGVNVAGYFESEKGVGEAARASLRALQAVPVPCVLNNVTDSGSWNRERPSSSYSVANPQPVNLVHVNADQVPMVASQLGDAYFRGRYNIGYWFWELSHFPEEWSSSFEYFDEVWVGSNFVLDAISRRSPIPVVRMPLALRERTDRVDREDRSNLGLSAESFVFVFMFDFHSFIARKNPLGLVEAFKMAFSDKDDVWLILKSAHSSTNASDFEAVKAATAGAKVKLIDTVLTEGETTALLSTCDCYVSLHRSEGFGLPIAEAMRLGKPVIVTAYSGNMDFTTPSNSLLVKYRLVELDRDYGPYKKGSVWADPSLDHAADLMRYAYENRDAGNAVGSRAREDVLQLFHPRVVGRQMHDRLQRMLSRGKDSGKGRHEPSSSPLTLAPSDAPVVVLPTPEAIRPPADDDVVASMISIHANYDISNTPLTSHRRVVGPVVGLTKKIIRQLVTPILRPQVSYNAANTRVVTHLKQQGEFLGRQHAELSTQLDQQGEFLGEQRMQVRQQAEALGRQQAQLQQQAEALGRQQAQLQQQAEALGRQQAQLQQQAEALDQQLKQQGEVLGQQQAHLRQDLLGRQEEALDGMRGRVSSVERRLRRMRSLLTDGQEEARPAQVETKSAIRQALDEDFDYFGLEERFRGSEEQIKDRQRMYADYFHGQEEVLDIGCGRGEFLELLRELGIKARGVDVDTDMVLLCREKGLHVVQEDAFSCLENLPDDSLGGIFAAQVIEHFPSDQIIRLVKRCYQKIRPGGVVVLETPNPQCLSVFARSFYMDFSHVWPCHPEAMRYLLESVGFEEIRVVFSSPVNASLGIPPVADARVFGEETDRFNRTAAFLNELLLGPQDYAIIGWRKG